MDDTQYKKLVNVCKYARGIKANPLMNADNCRQILMDWARDRDKSKEFRLLCETLAYCGKFETTIYKHKTYSIIEKNVIIGQGSAQELADMFTISISQIKYYARNGTKYEGKWLIKENTND